MGNRQSNRPKSAPESATPSPTRNGGQRDMLQQATITSADTAVEFTATANTAPPGSIANAAMNAAFAYPATVVSATAVAYPAKAGSSDANTTITTSTLTPGSISSDLASSSSTVDVSECQPIQLSQYQKTLLREAWQKINKKGSGGIGSLIFRRMFAKNPEIKQVFQHVAVIDGVFGFGLKPVQSTQQHSVLFVQILDQAIEQLDDLRPFVKQCVEFGAKHAPYRSYGFKADMWDVFGECMTESAREWEGWKKHRETIRAWTVLVSFIVDRMRQGYETAVRRQCFMQQLSMKQASLSSLETENEDIQKRSIATLMRVNEENTPVKSRPSSRVNLAAESSSLDEPKEEKF